MLIFSFFSWWYGAGWKQVAARFRPRLESVAAGFSVNQLLRTLFAPWRRIISYPGASFQDKVRAWGDNLFSRIIGFIVRVFVLIGGLVATLVIAILSLIELLVWPLLPLAIPVCIVAGLVS